MAKTVRLLSTYPNPAGGYYAPQTIVTLDDAVADALLVGNVGATLDLTGGSLPAYQDPGPVVNDTTPINTPLSPRGNRLALMGDSLTAFGSMGATGVPVTFDGRIATYTFANHGMTPGLPVISMLSSPSQPAYHGVFKVLSVPTANTFTVELRDAPTANATVQIAMPRSAAANAWWMWGNEFLRGAPFDIVVNAGVGSNTTDMMVSRFDTDVLAYGPTHINLLGGINDIRYAAAVSAEACAKARANAFENLKWMVRRSIQYGAVPILCMVPPVRSDETAYAIVNQNIVALNESMKNFAENTKGVILVDFNSPLSDKAATNGQADSTLLSDTVHWNGKAACRAGRNWAAAVAPYAPLPRVYAANNGDVVTLNASSANRLANPLQIAANGLLNGSANSGVAANWALTSSTATVTPTLVPRTVAKDGDDKGNNQRIQVSFTTAGETTRATSNQTITNFTAGDEVYFIVDVNIAAAAQVQYFLFLLTVTVGGNPYQVYVSSGSNNSFPNDEVPLRRWVKSRPFRLPPGAVTNAVLTVEVKGIAGQTGNIDYTLGLPNIVGKRA